MDVLGAVNAKTQFFLPSFSQKLQIINVFRVLNTFWNPQNDENFKNYIDKKLYEQLKKVSKLSFFTFFINV